MYQNYKTINSSFHSEHINKIGVGLEHEVQLNEVFPEKSISGVHIDLVWRMINRKRMVGTIVNLLNIFSIWAKGYTQLWYTNIL